MVDEVLRRPYTVGKIVPSDKVVIQSHRPGDAVSLDGIDHVYWVFFKGKLWGVYADNDQSIVGISGVPKFEKRKRPNAVNARVTPEIDQDHFADGFLKGDRI